MTFFKPLSGGYWQGNLKRYGLAWSVNGTQEIVDADGKPAITQEGYLKETARSYWSYTLDGGKTDKGGAGMVLKRRIDACFASHNYYGREVKTWKHGRMVDLTAASMNALDFNVADRHEADCIINFMHGYTFDADAKGLPLGVRPWILGDIMHSRPLVLDYVDANPARNLTHRYLVVGANDGMLHVFDSRDGSERLAFVPPDMWITLREFSNASRHEYGVDGFVTKYQRGRNPALVLFGERRGGRRFWALDCASSDPSQWHVAWSIRPTGVFAELGQSWSEMVIAPDVRCAGAASLDLGVFCGGYDPLEDRHVGSLPKADTQGRGIFVVNLRDGKPLCKATYGMADGISTTQGCTSMTHTAMRFCFPGSPTVVVDPKDQSLNIYALDIAGQLWKLRCVSGRWSLARLFAANGHGMEISGKGARKCFVAPEVSYRGDCSTDRPVVYFGTGDAVHPESDRVSNRFYAVFDMSQNASMNALLLPLDEKDLLDVTCVQEAGKGGLGEGAAMHIQALLGDDVSRQKQGWYIALDRQDACLSGLTPPGTLHHGGEKVLSNARLLNKKIYFTSYIPPAKGSGNHRGTALLYALRYCYGDASSTWTPEQPEPSGKKRSLAFINSSPPSSINLVSGTQGVMLNIRAGEKVISKQIETGNGVRLYWWKYAEEKE